MDRRTFLAAGVSPFVAAPLEPLTHRESRPRPSVQPPSPVARSAQAASSTLWQVHDSEGLDAIAFLGALSGGELYVREYGREASMFGERLSNAVRDDLAALARDADAEGFGLLWPGLATMVSGTEASSIEAVVAALQDPERLIRPAYQVSAYWNAHDWAWFTRAAARLRAVVDAMRAGGFASFRRELVGNTLSERARVLGRALADYDVVQWQRKLTGRPFDSTIEIVLLHFSRPHGVKVQGQRFLQSASYNVTTTLRIAAHEMLHPPVPMDGAAATAAVQRLSEDALVTRIVRDHDRRWGYNTLDGYLNEDLCQALDQLIAEQLGAARHPADRWRLADDGMHVLAAGLYALLREDRWVVSGGDLEPWLLRAATTGRLGPGVWHPAAARVLGLPPDDLWPAERQARTARHE